MQTYFKKQIRVIYEQNPKEFQEEFNAFMNTLAEQEITPEITFPQGATGTAYIVYQVSAKIPESFSDRFRLEGIDITCEECPMWKTFDKTDGRIKYHKCQKGECLAYKGKTCCEKYLQELWEAKDDTKGQN